MLSTAVRYEGFTDHPDLIAVLRAYVDSIPDDFGAFQDQVTAVFELKPGHAHGPLLRIVLTLNLGHLTEVNTAMVPWQDVQSAHQFRQWIRKVWTGLLDHLLDKRAKEVVTELATSAGE